MKKITKVAKKTKQGVVHTTKLGNVHADIPSKGEHGFIASDGKFKNRKQGAKIANKANQSKTKVRKLHSTDLKQYKGK